MCTALKKCLSIYEELLAITMVYHMVESHVLTPEDPLEKVLGGYEVERDTKAQDIESCLNLALADTRRIQMESLTCELVPPPKLSI